MYACRGVRDSLAYDREVAYRHVRMYVSVLVHTCIIVLHARLYSSKRETCVEEPNVSSVNACMEDCLSGCTCFSAVHRICIYVYLDTSPPLLPALVLFLRRCSRGVHACLRCHIGRVRGGI